MLTADLERAGFGSADIRSTFDLLAQRVARLPDVEAAALASRSLLSPDESTPMMGVTAPGSFGSVPAATVNAVSPSYSTWAAFQGEHYAFGNYLSPMYSPEIFGDSPHALFGPRPGWWPAWLPFSPAFLILWAPAGFRLTCYYYRGAYYKAFWADPPSCAVGEPRNAFRGENSFPLILQNAHRYFLYLALGFIVFLSYDVWNALWFEDAAGGASFGVGVGTLVLALNVGLLGGYTFSCHSLRHLVGGRRDCISASPCSGARTTA